MLWIEHIKPAQIMNVKNENKGRASPPPYINYNIDTIESP